MEPSQAQALPCVCVCARVCVRARVRVRCVCVCVCVRACVFPLQVPQMEHGQAQAQACRPHYSDSCYQLITLMTPPPSAPPSHVLSCLSPTRPLTRLPTRDQVVVKAAPGLRADGAHLTRHAGAATHGDSRRQQPRPCGRARAGTGRYDTSVQAGVPAGGSVVCSSEHALPAVLRLLAHAVWRALCFAWCRGTPDSPADGGSLSEGDGEDDAEARSQASWPRAETQGGNGVEQVGQSLSGAADGGHVPEQENVRACADGAVAVGGAVSSAPQVCAVLFLPPTP